MAQGIVRSIVRSIVGVWADMNRHGYDAVPMIRSSTLTLSLGLSLTLTLTLTLTRTLALTLTLTLTLTLISNGPLVLSG